MLHKTHLKVEQTFPFFTVLISCKKFSSVRHYLNLLKPEVHQSNIYKFSICLVGRPHGAFVYLMLFVMSIRKTHTYAVLTEFRAFECRSR
jgi:hypothetical protein